MPSNEFRNHFCDTAGLNLTDTELDENLGKKNTSTDATQIDTNKKLPYTNRTNTSNTDEQSGSFPIRIFNSSVEGKNCQVFSPCERTDNSMEHFMDNAADETPLADSADKKLNETPKQNFDNLPDELSFQPRFFTVGRDVNGVFNVKAPVVKWNNPRIQRHYARLVYTDPRQMAGFDIVGHGKAADYLVLDFDHVLTDDGHFINDAAQRWFNFVALSETYIEKSVSGRGLHAIFKPSSNEFKKLAAGNAATLHLSDSRANDAPKIEIFYKPNGRYFLLTGDCYQCAPKTPIATDCDVVSTILDEIKKQQPKPRSVAKKDTPVVSITDNQALAKDALKFIPCAEIDYTDWLNVGMILKTNGNSLDDWIDWSRTDSARFDEDTCRYKWTTFKDAGELNIGSLIFMAEKFGYVERDFKRQYRKIQREQKLQESRERFKELLTLPQSNNRDNEMRQILLQSCDFNKSGKIIRSVHNGKIIFSGDPVINGLFGYDEFSDRIVFLKSPTWRKVKSGDIWKSTDDIQLSFYVRENYADFSDQKTINECTVHFAQLNSFHNVKRYLENLHWDGTPRAETVFIDFLEVEDSPYSRAVTLHWLLGAIARVYYPGCDFQTCLVLAGQQGIGKSHILRQLGREWHISLVTALDDEHSVDAIQSSWLCEIEEFSAARKAELNAVKSFLSRPADDRRAPYARREERYPRHCVFAVTTNDKEFLRDRTGNRRFKILQCQAAMNQFKEGLTDAYIGQIWAEVLTKFKQMFAVNFDAAKLRLPREFDEMAEKISEQFLLDDGLQNAIASYLDTPIPEKAVWILLTRVERKKFFENGKIEFFRRDEFKERYAALPNIWKTCEIQNSYYAIIKKLNEDEDFEGDEVPNSQLPADLQDDNPQLTKHLSAVTFYGTESRQHVCATEITNECLGGDRRISSQRIVEVLDKLPNWRCTGRNQNLDPQYKDQRKTYYRVDA